MRAGGLGAQALLVLVIPIGVRPAAAEPCWWRLVLGAEPIPCVLRAPVWARAQELMPTATGLRLVLFLAPSP